MYGSEEKLALYLRNLRSDAGLLRVNTEFTDSGRELLPFHPMQVEMCATRRRITNNANAREIPCFIAGKLSWKLVFKELEPIPAATGREAGYTLDMSPGNQFEPGGMMWCIPNLYNIVKLFN